MSFAQLQIISTHSLMESTLTIHELIKTAKQKGYQALALSDHNVLYGAIEFYETALKNDIKPIIGLTLDVEGFIMNNEIYPLLLLAKNYEGYQALIQLSTMIQLSDQKAIALDEIIARSDHLVVIAPGDQGEIISFLKNKRIAEANEIKQYYKENIKDFYLGVSLQDNTEETLSFYKQNKEHLVALGNVQYLKPNDALPSKVLQVLNSDVPLGSENQAQIHQFLSQNDKDYSLKSPDEMIEQFRAVDLEEACETTEKIAENTDLKLELNHHIMPTYPVPEGRDSDQFLKELCEEALEQRVEEVTEEYLERLNKELKVITTMGFSDYFLIVWDIIRYAHRQNIYTGSGRGSAAGSLVAYLLNITNVDPIEYHLLFERFLNEERYTLPDIDLDFPDNRREEILTYIYDKYGKENVAQIGTIGTYGAKSAVRDVARVLGASQEEIKQWAKAIPSGPNVSLENGLKNQDLQNLVHKNERNRNIYEIAKNIQGRNRHVSTHAAAVVIADHPIIEKIPLQKGSSDIHLTQYTMEAVEKVGLLKLDILGLRNLSILADCIHFIPFENKGKKIDIDQIPFDDQKTLEIFRKGNTDGIFQFESPGIRRVLRKLQPNSFEDIVAVNALYRPGPMKQIDTFIRRKNGEEPIKYPHNDLKEILDVTYGVMVYQEQVMQVASIMAGYTLNEADILRRAISKKSHEEIEKGRQQFVQGSIENNYSKETALEVYGYIERFADYGFNRSHAVAYSKVAYQLAYVKANYPASFFAAIMKASNKDKIKTYKTESKQYGVEVLAPDINKSLTSFIIEKGKVRFGLEMIKGLPRDFVREVIKERINNGDYVNLVNFLNRIDEKWLKEELIFPLINSGAFDSFEATRSSLSHSLPSVMESIKMSHGNVELFDIFAPVIEPKTEFSDEEKMKQEYEATGFYFTSEPGEKYNELRKDSKIKYLTDISKGTYVRLLVTVENIKSIQTKKGQPMSFVDVVDSTGKGNLTLFPNIHRRYIQKFDQGDTILIDGKVEQTKYPAKIIVSKLMLADELLKNQSKQQPSNNEEKVLYIRFDSLKSEQKKLNALQELLLQNRGQTPVVLYDQETKEQKAFKQNYYVEINDQMLEQLNKMFGKQNIVLKSS
ncbi:MAG TPA: DNA polymerase III subunit alpha [Candidatus Atopostipes pullistercoris]|uniref:DNA polymerase III subunit alpha n=1 Tax=Candidatus Atopostipes pullistercoris TaxID=2838467 RepID=A0A9D2JZI2_9LACT|nr:DNA polymerase III subunit alpha [Candidatus Atopostipes pullistercoris]